MLALKRLLGHSTLMMVEHYVHLVTDDLQESHQHASPIRFLEDNDGKNRALSVPDGPLGMNSNELMQ